MILIRARAAAALVAARSLFGVRLCSSSSLVSFVEIGPGGEASTRQVTTESLLQSIPKKLPLRDLRQLLQTSSAVKRLPALLPRPSSDCYILDIEHIRLLCYRDRCLLLEPGCPALQTFLSEIRADLGPGESKQLPRSGRVCEITDYYRRALAHQQDFEHIVLEAALSNIVRRFKRHLEIIKPALEVLLTNIQADPASHNLRRLLAFRKSLTEFEQTVGQCQKLVRGLATSDEDMVGLYLTRPERELQDHEELELLFEAYCADFEEVEAEIRAVKEMIEDTNQFTGAHLDSVRNRMIRLSLLLEVGALALGSGAVVGGVFGMNLTHGLEEHPTAFLAAVGGMALVMGGICAAGTANYRKLQLDTSQAANYKVLKSFFTYVDELEFIVSKQRLTGAEFRAALGKVSGLKVTEEEADFIFQMFDTNKDGLIHTVEELNILRDKQL